jgi:hypothetical protein
MCADPTCGCHVPKGWTCSRPAGCSVGLYVVVPDEPRPELVGFERELASIHARHPKRGAA